MARWVLPTPGGPRRSTLVAFGDEDRVCQFVDQSLVVGGLEAKVELLHGALEVQMSQPGPSGEVAFPTGCDIDAQQFGQHHGIGQLRVGGGVQGVVQDVDRLLEAQCFQMLAGLFQGDNPTPPATNSYTFNEHRSTSPTRTRTATASWRGRLSPLRKPDR